MQNDFHPKRGIVSDRIVKGVFVGVLIVLVLWARAFTAPCRTTILEKRF